jgi:phage gp16-like protein
MSKLARDHRNADLARIHMGVAALGWNDDDYRAVLVAKTGKASAADLDAAGRKAFLDHLQRCGWKPTKKPFTQADKIAWLWRKLGSAGVVRDQSPAALRAFVGRTAGMDVEHLKFLPSAEASKVIEALKAMLNRAASAAAARRAARTQPSGPRTPA